MNLWIKKKVKTNSQILILVILFFLFILALSPQDIIGELLVIDEIFGSIDAVEITVLVDNNANGSLQSPWGVSMLIETNNSTILMDAGGDPNALGNNSVALGKDLKLVDYVVLSHEHADHYWGLPYVAQVNPGLTVYVPISMSTRVKTDIINWGFNIVEINETTTLSPGIAIIGQLSGPPFEQALTVNVKNVGLVTTVGCSHPGVENIVGKAVEDFQIDPYLVMGGFHLNYAPEAKIKNTVTTLLDLGVDKIYPIHCSGDRIRSYLANNFPENYGEGAVGTHIVIDQRFATTTRKISNGIILFSFIIIPITSQLIRKRKGKNEISSPF